MRYRRANAPGGTFFFSVNLANRSSRLLTEHIDVLRDGVRRVRHAHPFTIVAMVVLPDHLHAIWTLPAGDGNYALRWSLIKAGFSRHLEKTDPVSAVRRRKRERGIWQRRYWEHQLRDEADLARHVDYIHINPVKHGHAGTPVEWPYSSIHRYIRQGILPANWAIEWGESGSGFGE
jgi:putative transposase